MCTSRTIWSFLRKPSLTQFDLTTPEGRDKARYRLAVFGFLANAIRYTIQFALLLISVSLTLPYLGQERFGIWMTVASLSSVLLIMDAGVGNALISNVARIRARGPISSLQTLISDALILLAIIGAIAAALLATINLVFPFQNILNTSSNVARADAILLSWTFIAIFSISIPLNGVSKILQGLQQSWIAHSVAASAALLSILLVWILASHEASPWILLVSTYGVQTAFPLLVLPFFHRNGYLALPRDRGILEFYLRTKGLVRTGGLFFVLQIGGIIGWGIDPLLLSALANPSEVTDFTLANRLFQIVPMLLAMLTTPLWSAYADAYAHGDTEFIRRIFLGSVLGGLVMSSLLALAILVLAPTLLEIWVGSKTTVPYLLLVGTAVWAILQTIGHTYSMFLNGLHIVRTQVVAVTIFCILALPLKLFLIPTQGATGAILATVFSYVPAIILYYSLLTPSILNKYVPRRTGQVTRPVGLRPACEPGPKEVYRAKRTER